MALGGVRGRAQVALGHQDGVDVVVADRAVLVGSGYAVDPKAPGRVVVSERSPQPGRLHQQLQPNLALELLIVGGELISPDGVGDRGVDVKRRCPRRPVAGTLLSVDRAPRERGSREAPRAGPLAPPCL